MKHHKVSFFALLFCLVLFPAVILAGPPHDPRTLPERLYYFGIPNALNETEARRDAARDALVDIMGKNANAFLYYALPATVVGDSFKAFLQSVEKARVDEQVGPAGGISSTITKTGLVTLLAVGLDSPDATQTVDQNIATLRINADGLTRFLSNQDVIPICLPTDTHCGAAGPLKNVELSASIGASDSGTKTINGVLLPSADALAADPSVGPTPASFSSSVKGGRFGSASIRYAVLNKRDLRSAEYRERWIRWFQVNDETVRTEGRDLWNYLKLVLQQMQQTGPSGRLSKDSGETDQYTIWLADTRAKLRNAARIEPDWQRTLQEQLDLLLDNMRKIDRDFDTRLTDLAKAYIRYVAMRRDPELIVSTDPALTVEYTYSEPALQPRLHTLNLAYAFSPGRSSDNPGTITFNAGLDYYHTAQITETAGSTSRWRGGHAGLQFDRPIGPADSPAQLSVSGYYQYLLHPVISVPADATFPTDALRIPAGTTLLAPKGSMYVGEATLILRTARNGLKIPIGVSWSNRTDFQKGREIRGHIGFVFDTVPLLLLPRF